jgi:hypothetical protein
MSTYRQAYDLQNTLWRLVQNETGSSPISLAVVRIGEGWGLRVGVSDERRQHLPDQLDGVPIQVRCEERARLIS